MTTTVLILLALYFLPTLIATLRGKSNTLAIFVLNLFLGWTLIGWVVSLVWSFTQDTEPVKQVFIVNSPSSPANSTPVPPLAAKHNQRPYTL